VNKKRVLCTECQILRDMEYRPTASKKCEACEHVFYPVRLSYRVCNPCREYMERPERYQPCKVCAKHLRPAPGLSGTCMSCVQRTPEMRRKYVNTLRKVVAERGKGWREAGRPGYVDPKGDLQ
jgi:hypothetical protein